MQDEIALRCLLATQHSRRIYFSSAVSHQFFFFVFWPGST